MSINGVKVFNQMGGCNCKKRKVCNLNNVDLLPSKMTLEDLVKRKTNGNCIEETIQNMEDFDCKSNTRRRERLNSSPTRKNNKEKVRAQIHRRSNSTSSISNCRNPATKSNIIIHQNIIINPVGGGDSNFKLKTVSSVKSSLYSDNKNFKSKTSVNYTSVKGPSKEANEKKTKNHLKTKHKTNTKQEEANNNIEEKTVETENSVIFLDSTYEESDTTISSLSSAFNRAYFFKRISNGRNSCSLIEDITLNSFSSYTTDTSVNIDILSSEVSQSWHKIHRLSKGKGKTNSSLGDVYNMEYLEDIYIYTRKIETTTVLKTNFLKDYNPDQKLRSETVNWMLKIQAEIGFCDSEFYIAVYLLDKVLANIYIPDDIYKLLAVSVIWIAMKLFGSGSVVKASLLVHITGECYIVEQLLKMEENVLRLVNFQIYALEPSVCVFYYVKKLQLQHDNLSRISALYALDLLSLLPEFSSTVTSLIAAAAVSFVQSILCENTHLKLNRLFLDMFTKEEIQKIKSVEILLYIQLKNMTDENYSFREPYNKYKLGNLMCISKFISDIV